MMHELAVTRSIFEIVRKHAKKDGVVRVVKVFLEIGALSDLQNEWIQRYFDHLSRGSVAEGAILEIQRVPALFSCGHCKVSIAVDLLSEDGLSCPQCNRRDLTLISGNEYNVKNMEVMWDG